MKKSFLRKTAILVFANSPEEELRHKSLFKATELFADLTDRTLRKVRKTGIPYFHISEKQQRGRNFGERFVNAIQGIFDLGFQYAITIGNDTPQLNTGHILQTVDLLQQGAVVLGPSNDGGFYLMGLQKSQFAMEAYKELPWQTSILRSSLIALVANNGSKVVALNTLADIDSINDLRLLAKRTINIPFSIFKYLIKISCITLPSEVNEDLYSNSFIISSLYNKGSPGLYSPAI